MKAIHVAVLAILAAAIFIMESAKGWGGVLASVFFAALALVTILTNISEETEEKYRNK